MAGIERYTPFVTCRVVDTRVHTKAYTLRTAVSSGPYAERRILTPTATALIVELGSGHP